MLQRKFGSVLDCGNEPKASLEKGLFSGSTAQLTAFRKGPLLVTHHESAWRTVLLFYHTFSFCLDFKVFHCELCAQNSSSIFEYMSVRPSPTVTSPFISTIWCSRPYKPYIFWRLIIWWRHCPRRRRTKTQIQIQGDFFNWPPPLKVKVWKT